MNRICLRRITKKFIAVFSVALLGSFFLLLVPGDSQAAASLYLNPSGGTFGQSFTINLVVNTGGKPIVGVESVVNFSGPVSYSGGSSGSFCSAVFHRPSSSQVQISCLNPPTGYFNGTGTVASLTFIPTGHGTASMSLTHVDVGFEDDGEAVAISGGTYTISPGSANLPSTGIVQDVAIVGTGVALVLLGGYVVISQRERIKGLRNVVILKE